MIVGNGLDIEYREIRFPRRGFNWQSGKPPSNNQHSSSKGASSAINSVRQATGEPAYLVELGFVRWDKAVVAFAVKEEKSGRPDCRLARLLHVVPPQKVPGP